MTNLLFVDMSVKTFYF